MGGLGCRVRAVETGFPGAAAAGGARSVNIPSGPLGGLRKFGVSNSLRVSENKFNLKTKRYFL